MPATEASSRPAARQVLGEATDRANWSPATKKKNIDDLDGATKALFATNTKPTSSGQVKSSATPADAGSKKRKSTDSADSAKNVDLDAIHVPMPYGMPDKNCDQVRRKITRLLDSGEMKVGEFCSAIGVSNTALNRFRGQSGATKGDRSDAYVMAWEYFEKRDIAGVKIPSKSKKAKIASEAGTSGTSKSKSSTHTDISDVHLEDEDSDDVPVYETCDEVRKKIAAHLRKPEVTQAQFCRDLYAQLHSDRKPKSIQSSQLSSFRNNKGPNAGNTSFVFYAAYVLFEKMRIREGKPKSKHRQEMEGVWPDGFDRETNHNRGFWCAPGERPREDLYGRVTFG